MIDLFECVGDGCGIVHVFTVMGIDRVAKSRVMRLERSPHRFSLRKVTMPVGATTS